VFLRKIKMFGGFAGSAVMFILANNLLQNVLHAVMGGVIIS